MADRTEETYDAALVGLHTLKPAPGSRKDRKRVGRGEGSGTGKTSGRGQKGADDAIVAETISGPPGDGELPDGETPEEAASLAAVEPGQVA